MITFSHITAADAFSYRYLDFDFRSGLSAVEGVNGASKTSIFMALQIGLFNRCFKECKIEAVNNTITAAPFEISITFTRDEFTYVVVNSRKLGKITITRNGVDISLKRIPENLKLIEEILGTDYKTFLDLTYQAKESSLNLLETSTDKGRKEFIARILKLDEIDAEQARMKEKEKELAGKNGRILQLRTAVEMLSGTQGEEVAVQDILDVTAAENELQKLNLVVGELQLEVLRLGNESNEVQKEVNAWNEEQSLREQLIELKSTVDDTSVGDMAGMQALVLETSAKVTANSTAITTLTSLIKQLEKYEGVENSIAGTEETLALLPHPEMSYEECKVQKEKISNAWKARQGKIDAALTELAKFETAQAKGECPTCGGHADVSQQIKTLQEDLQKDTLFVDKCTSSYEKYKGWLSRWEAIHTTTATLEKLQAEVSGKPEGDLVTCRVNLGLLQGETALLVQNAEEAVRRQEAANFQDKLKIQILELNARITRGVACLYKDEYVAMVKDNLGKANAQLVSIRGDIDCTQQELEERKDHNATVRATEALNNQIRENNQKIALQIDQLQKELEAKEDKLELLKSWQGILGGKGYRVARIRKFISSLNSLMVKYAQMISGGRIKCTFFITESGEIDFTILDDAKEMAYELWSGGEKARVKLVCLFAVLELLESMGSLSFNVLALDEIFSALDTEGKEGLFNVLTYLKGRNKALYTIAHEDLVLDLQYDHKVKAEKLADGTTEVHYV